MVAETAETAYVLIIADEANFEFLHRSRPASTNFDHVVFADPTSLAHGADFVSEVLSHFRAVLVAGKNRFRWYQRNA